MIDCALRLQIASQSMPSWAHCPTTTISETRIPGVVRVENAADFYTDPAFWVSALSIALSGLAIYVATSQSNKARSQSINDDYWFRTVIHSDFTAPALSLFNEIQKSIPAHNGQQSAVDFLSTFPAAVAKIQGATETVGVVTGVELMNKLISILEELEDKATTYAGNVASGTATQNDEISIKELINTSKQGVVQALSNYQSTL